MAYRNGTYSAFYVKEPFRESNLAANATEDFVYYNLLRAWKGNDPSFPFVDSHDKNYCVRDGSDWEKTLKPRIHDRINNSKNMILFLSSISKSSKALREEIDFGINTNGLPVIAVYPEYSNKSDIIDCSSEMILRKIKNLWDKLPIFRNSMAEVPTIHLPNRKSLIKMALQDKDFMVATKCEPREYFYSC